MKRFFAEPLKKTGVVVCLFAALLIVFCYYLFYYSAVLRGLNEQGDALKEAMEKREERLITVEGSIIDARGDVITFAEKPGVSAKCVSPAYSQLVGFNTYKYGAYGLRRQYADALFTGDKNHQGSTLQLTTVNRIQLAAYQEIQGTEGCVVVLENKTGRILAIATAYPGVEMDVNNLDANWAQMQSPDNDGFQIQNWRKALAPGSTMKPLTATLIYDEGLADTVYHDTGTETIDGYDFHNAGNAANGDITLHRAIVKSCNTYFAHMTDQIGAFKLQERAEKLYIGQNLTLDFCTLLSGHSLMKSDTAEIAAAGFGQGRLELTPIHIAMIGECLANGGKLKKPYLIDNITNAKGTIYRGKTEDLGRVCTKKAAAYVSDAMKDAAISYGIDKKYGIHAKTGTAQVNGRYRASFVAFNDRYTVCIVENNTGKAGKKLAGSAVRLFKALEELA